MYSDPPLANDFSGCPIDEGMDAARNFPKGPPPLPGHIVNRPVVSHSEDAIPPEKEVVEGAAPLPESKMACSARERLYIRVPSVPASADEAAKTQTEADDSRWMRLKRRLKPFAAVAAARFTGWYRENGHWYLISMAAHAVGLFCLALISLTIPPVIVSLWHEPAPSFDAPDVNNSPPTEITRFEVGDAPLDPTELNAETLMQTKAMPLGRQEARYYDNSPVFEDAGGGIVSIKNEPKLGGLGGLNIKGLPGPGGLGGVGIGVGLGKNPGFGGAGEGFGSRGKGHRDAMLGAFGGTMASERAVGAALNWLHRHQTKQGKWSLDFRHQCKNETCAGSGAFQSDAAATALALLPFLAAGETHKSKGPYKQTVAKGVAWLIKQQRSDGDLSGGCDQPMYAHGMATLTLCELYGMTKDEQIGSAARQGAAFIERAQNESTGGWRYVPQDPSGGDTSVFGWQIMALKSAQLADLPVNSVVFDNAQKWLHSVAKGEHLGLFSYQPYREVTPTMTAVGMLCHQYLGIAPKSPAMLEGKQALLQNLPDNTLGRNTYYWYYATLAMHNFADADWNTWNRKMRRALIETQIKVGCATGSWDPEKPTLDAWGSSGGRLMTTSLSALTLEVYYRYLPLFKTDSLVPQLAKPSNIPE